MKYQQNISFPKKGEKLIYENRFNKKLSSNQILWDKMFNKLNNFSKDFMDNRKQLTQTREKLF